MPWYMNAVTAMITEKNLLETNPLSINEFTVLLENLSYLNSLLVKIDSINSGVEELPLNAAFYMLDFLRRRIQLVDMSDALTVQTIFTISVIMALRVSEDCICTRSNFLAIFDADLCQRLQNMNDDTDHDNYEAYISEHIKSDLFQGYIQLLNELEHKHLEQLGFNLSLSKDQILVDMVKKYCKQDDIKEIYDELTSGRYQETDRFCKLFSALFSQFHFQDGPANSPTALTNTKNRETSYQSLESRIKHKVDNIISHNKIDKKKTKKMLKDEIFNIIGGAATIQNLNGILLALKNKKFDLLRAKEDRKDLLAHFSYFKAAKNTTLWGEIIDEIKYKAYDLAINQIFHSWLPEGKPDEIELAIFKNIFQEKTNSNKIYESLFDSIIRKKFPDVGSYSFLYRKS